MECKNINYNEGLLDKNTFELFINNYFSNGYRASTTASHQVEIFMNYYGWLKLKSKGIIVNVKLNLII